MKKSAKNYLQKAKVATLNVRHTSIHAIQRVGWDVKVSIWIGGGLIIPEKRIIPQ